ncbi:hypothetical protein RJ639_012546 [Escallonia herrerae]|uniref:Pectinesterase inhibitor domain-containing protein n=1 Tax=Escallonia herrerae TaxID=1293975 RepID=A0AA88VQC7_9ASTE|nr:hypothetical protein RJ639_012546 [Escallonia herrerae]
MAVPIPRSILLISLLLVLSLFGPSFARPNADADSFCIDALKSDPRATTDDIKVLAQVSIELATFNATGTRVKIHSLLLASRDPGLTDDLNKCADLYDIALSYLESAPETLKTGDYNALNLFAVGAADISSKCENTFKGPPPYQSPLSTDNNNTSLLCEIVKSIATITNCRCPDAAGKGPSRSIPHIAKGIGETTEVKGAIGNGKHRSADRAMNLPKAATLPVNSYTCLMVFGDIMVALTSSSLVSFHLSNPVFCGKLHLEVRSHLFRPLESFIVFDLVKRAFILPGGLLLTENVNLDVGKRPRRNAVYFTDSSRDNLLGVSFSGTELRHPLSVDRSSRGLRSDDLFGRRIGTVFD